MMTLALVFDTSHPGVAQAVADRIATQAEPEPCCHDALAAQPCRKDGAFPRAAAPVPDRDAVHGARLTHLQAALRRLMGGAYSGPTVVAVATAAAGTAPDAAAGADAAEQAMSILTDERDVFAVTGRTGQRSAAASAGLFCLHFSNGDGDDRLPLSHGDETVVMLASGIKAFAVEREQDSLTLRFGAGSSITFDGLANAGAIGVARWSDTSDMTLLYTPLTSGLAG